MHVLDHNQACAGGDDQAFGRDRAVRDVRHVLVQHRDRRHELAQQAECRVDVQCHVGGFREPQDLRQPMPAVASDTSASVDAGSFRRSTLRTWP
jgi:hypothetical protein